MFSARRSRWRGNFSVRACGRFIPGVGCRAMREGRRAGRGALCGSLAWFRRQCRGSVCLSVITRRTCGHRRRMRCAGWNRRFTVAGDIGYLRAAMAPGRTVTGARDPIRVGTLGSTPALRLVHPDPFFERCAHLRGEDEAKCVRAVIRVWRRCVAWANASCHALLGFLQQRAQARIQLKQRLVFGIVRARAGGGAG